VTEISGMQSGKLSSENILCLELNKHLLHIIETASLEYSRAVFIIGHQEEEEFLQKIKMAFNHPVIINYQRSY
jgi:hypothetical protein